MNSSNLKYIFLAIILLTGAPSYAGYISNVEEVDSLSVMGTGPVTSTIFATTWMYNIRDDEGYTPGSVLSATLDFDFGDSFNKFAFVWLKVGQADGQDDTMFYVPTNGWSVDLGQNSLAKLNEMGVLRISAFTTLRSFSIVDAVLGVTTSGEGESEGGVSVPEPSSLALLALGLVGLGVCRRKTRLS